MSRTRCCGFHCTGWRDSTTTAQRIAWWKKHDSCAGAEVIPEPYEMPAIGHAMFDAIDDFDTALLRNRGQVFFTRRAGYFFFPVVLRNLLIFGHIEAMRSRMLGSISSA